MTRHPPSQPTGKPPPITDAGKSPREYGHSSGDRNTKAGEGDWQGFHGGSQRDATPEGPPADPETHPAG